MPERVIIIDEPIDVNLTQNGGTTLPKGDGDAKTAASMPVEGVNLYNGSTYDRWRSTGVGDGVNVGLPGVVPYLNNGTSHDRLKGDNTGAARVSLYGKASAAGDTPVLVDSAGRPLVDVRKFGGADVVLAVSDNLTIANIPVFVPGMSNGGTGAERLHSVDGVGDGTTFGLLANGGFLWNLGGWDKQRGNLDNYVLMASAARTTSQTSPDITNFNHRGVIVVIDTTAVPGPAPSNTVTISGKDPVSGKYYTILTSAPITEVSTTVLTVYPGLTAVANQVANNIVPRRFQVKVTAGNANSATYSVAIMFVL